MIFMQHHIDMLQRW